MKKGKLNLKINGTWTVIYDKKVVKNCYGCKPYETFDSLPVLQEETDELRLQLQQKDSIILDMKQSTEQEKQKLTKEKQRAVEQAIVVQFPVNTECI